MFLYRAATSALRTLPVLPDKALSEGIHVFGLFRSLLLLDAGHILSQLRPIKLRPGHHVLQPTHEFIQWTSGQFTQTLSGYSQQVIL